MGFFHHESDEATAYEQVRVPLDYVPPISDYVPPTHLGHQRPPQG